MCRDRSIVSLCVCFVFLHLERKSNYCRQNKMSHSQYLKDSVGEILAHAIAHTVEQQPSDPVEFLALYLLHQIQIREVVSKRRQSDRERLDNERVEHEEKRQRAAAVIQSEFRRYLEAKRRKHEEEEILKKQLEMEMEEHRRRE